jgi:hypothetical protein
VVQIGYEGQTRFFADAEKRKMMMMMMRGFGMVRRMSLIGTWYLLDEERGVGEVLGMLEGSGDRLERFEVWSGNVEIGWDDRVRVNRVRHHGERYKFVFVRRIGEKKWELEGETTEMESASGDADIKICGGCPGCPGERE